MNQTRSYKIKKFNSDGIQIKDDCIAIEEPLEIQLSYNIVNSDRLIKTISITMRTPGDVSDAELAAGFLLTEGIIRFKHDIKNFYRSGSHSILVNLVDGLMPDIEKLERHFYTSSSCGVCGKTSIEAVRLICPDNLNQSNPRVKAEIVNTLPGKLREKQKTFNSTGGLHASALFNESGNLIELREDVGRHNALDKLIGYALLQDMMPLTNRILLLSGRASFELIQKSAMAGISTVCSVGAPSSLAVDLALESGITLVGFLRDDRFNVYSNEESVIY